VSPVLTIVLFPESEEDSTPFIAIKILLGFKRFGSTAFLSRNANISDTEAVGLSKTIDGLPIAFFAPPSSLIKIK
jgi:hypothetical protein